MQWRLEKLTHLISGSCTQFKALTSCQSLWPPYPQHGKASTSVVSFIPSANLTYTLQERSLLTQPDNHPHFFFPPSNKNIPPVYRELNVLHTLGKPSCLNYSKVHVKRRCQLIICIRYSGKQPFHRNTEHEAGTHTHTCTSWIGCQCCQ